MTQVTHSQPASSTQHPHTTNTNAHATHTHTHTHTCRTWLARATMKSVMAGPKPRPYSVLAELFELYTNVEMPEPIAVMYWASRVPVCSEKCVWRCGSVCVCVCECKHV